MTGLSKAKRYLSTLTFCVWRQKNGSSKNLSKALIVITAFVIPIATVSLDMFYSDTKVLYQLGKYAFATVSGNNTNFSQLNKTETEHSMGSSIDASYIVLWASLFLVYFCSLVSFIFSPWLSSLSTSYKTSMSLLKEDVDLVTNMGDNISCFESIKLSLSFRFCQQI